MNKHFLNLRSVFLIGIVSVCSFNAYSGPEQQEKQDIMSAKAAIQRLLRDHDFSTQIHLEKVKEAELAIALLSARNTPDSSTSVISLLAYKLDGSLSEHLTCSIADRPASSLVAITESSAEDIEHQCLNDFMVGVGSAENFCRTKQETEAELSEIAAMLKGKRHCD